jgi:hypothetical protein
MSFERSHVIDHRRKIVTRNSNGREKWRVEVMVLHLESREEGFRPRSMNTTRMRPLLAKDSLHWKKPVNEGNSRGRIFRSQIKASSTRTSSSSRTIKKGVNPCERGYCLYRSDRPIGSASPRHARAFPYRGEHGRLRRSVWLGRRSGDIVKKVGDPGNELEFDAINVEFFVIKQRLH